MTYKEVQLRLHNDNCAHNSKIKSSNFIEALLCTEYPYTVYHEWECKFFSIEEKKSHGECYTLYMIITHNFKDTIDSRYITVIYNTIVQAARQLQWQNFCQTLHSWTTPHTSSLRVNYGLSFVRYSKKNDRDISRVYCTFYWIQQSTLQTIYM